MNYVELEEFLAKKINHARIDVIGTSVLKRYLYAVTFDFLSSQTVIIQGAIHAREHITTDLICELIKNASENYQKYKLMGMPNIVFVPMVNPDGVELCCHGLASVRSLTRRRVLKSINGSTDFSQFKANANGVDLNNNFDAKWGSGKESCFVASPHGFVGEAPMSEPEVQSLALFTMKIKPFFTISYHAKGQEIYYEFFNKLENRKRDKRIAKLISKATYYKIVSTENSSSGGYKDWCVLRFGIPAVTIEVGKDSLLHPISRAALGQIYRRNKNILKALPKILMEFENDRKRKNDAARTKRGKESV